MEDLSYEQQAHDAGYALVCGVDEAGAGPLMGPVYAAAVILPEKFELPGLNDSKKLTEKKREALFLRIQQQALTWSVASVSAGEIDETDIRSEEHTSELQSLTNIVCRHLLEKKKKKIHLVLLT